MTKEKAPVYRIRVTGQLAKPASPGEPIIAQSGFAPYRVDRRVAGLFWRELHACRDLDSAKLLIRDHVFQARLKRLAPRVIASFSADGKEITP
jgi:hypothetical protein